MKVCTYEHLLVTQKDTHDYFWKMCLLMTVFFPFLLASRKRKNHHLGQQWWEINEGVHL